MKQAYGYMEKGQQFFIVLLPILITQLSLMATGFFNTIMAGQISEQDLAGVAVGVNLFMPFFSAALGIISGLTPVVAQLYGAGRTDQAAFVVKQGFYWAAALAASFVLLGYAAVPLILPQLALEPRVAAITRDYFMAVSAGILPVFLAAVLRNFVEAHGYTRLSMAITLVTVPVNIACNYVLMYGLFGVPAFGGAGAGVGSAITFTLSFFLYAAAVTHLAPFREYGIFHHLPRPHVAAWKKQLGIGFLIGGTMFCEQSIFGAVGLLMTAYGTVVVAAHQAAMNFTTVVYMIPLSASMALTILVGFEVGAGRHADARDYIRLGRILTFLFEGMIALLLVQHRDAVASLYSGSDSVLAILPAFLVFAVFMQFADSINAPLQGALRGYKDVHVTFLLSVLSYWIIGLPLGWVAAHFTDFGAYGYWVGLIGGVFVGAIFLAIRLRMVERRNA